MLERYGVPMFVAKSTHGAVFLDDSAVSKFSDEEILKMLGGTLVMSSSAASQLANRGFSEYIGVSVREWNGSLVTYENIRAVDTTVRRQWQGKELVPNNDSVSVTSDAITVMPDGTNIPVYPASTVYKNSLGGTVAVFSGTIDVEFHYDKTASFLNSSRKAQIVNLLKCTGNLPVYYSGDLDTYVRAGYLSNGTLLCALFNISLDQMENIPLVIDKPFTKIEILTPDGIRRETVWHTKDGVTYIAEPAITLIPVVLFIS